MGLSSLETRCPMGLGHDGRMTDQHGTRRSAVLLPRAGDPPGTQSRSVAHETSVTVDPCAFLEIESLLRIGLSPKLSPRVGRIQHPVGFTCCVFSCATVPCRSLLSTSLIRKRRAVLLQRDTALVYYWCRCMNMIGCSGVSHGLFPLRHR